MFKLILMIIIPLPISPSAKQPDKPAPKPPVEVDDYDNFFVGGSPKPWVPIAIYGPPFEVFDENGKRIAVSMSSSDVMREAADYLLKRQQGAR